jgi:hypothetical protein
VRYPDDPPSGTSFQVAIIVVLVFLCAGKLAERVGAGYGPFDQGVASRVPGTAATHLEIVGRHPAEGWFVLVSLDGGAVWFRLSQDRHSLLPAPPDLVRFALDVADKINYTPPSPE